MTSIARINVYGPYKRGDKWRVVLKSDDVQQAETFSTEAEAIAHRDQLRRETTAPPRVVACMLSSLDEWMSLLSRCASNAGSYVYAIRPLSGGLTKIGTADEADGWFAHMTDEEPTSAQEEAGWLAAQIVNGDEP